MPYERRVQRFTVLAALLVLVACDPGVPVPSFDTPPDQSTVLGEPVTVPVTVTTSGPGAVTLSATSSDQTVVPASGLAVAGGGTDFTLTITPSSTVPGISTITVTAQVAGGAFASRQFAIEVNQPFVEPGFELTPENGDLIGRSVAISRDYAVVGGQEFVYVFERDGTQWHEMAKLTASDAALGQDFGNAVAVDGDRIVVGAHSHDEGGERAGAAYIFERIGGTWVELNKLTDPLAEAFDSFGRSVAINGDYVVVGAQNDYYGDVRSGSVFVFQDLESEGWTVLDKLAPTDPEEEDVFGEDVSIDGGLMIVGNYAGNTFGFESGQATIFRLDGFVWVEDVELAPVGLESGDQFGVTVSVSGEYALVGAPNDDDAALNAGAAYVFHRGTGGWSLLDKLVPPDANDHEGFGYRVSLSFPYAVIGAMNNDEPLENAGAAYVFRYDGAEWFLVAELDSPTPTAGGGFGWDVAVADEFVIVSSLGASESVAVFSR